MFGFRKKCGVKGYLILSEIKSFKKFCVKKKKKEWDKERGFVNRMSAIIIGNLVSEVILKVNFSQSKNLTWVNF